MADIMDDDDTSLPKADLGPYSGNQGCLNCDFTGWVCDTHRDRPWKGSSRREDACDCSCGIPCQECLWVAEQPIPPTK